MMKKGAVQYFPCLQPVLYSMPCPKEKHNQRSAAKPVLSSEREYLACSLTQLCNFSNTDNIDTMIQTNQVEMNLLSTETVAFSLV